MVEYLGLGGDDLVVEAASNDGSLLKCYRDEGVRTLGVEPARNIAAIARGEGIETIDEFFNVETARRVRTSHGPAAAVVGNNVLAHVDDTQGFLAGFKTLLSEEGMGITEAPYLREFVDRLEYDTVYHEHLCYFSVTTLARLCESVGLTIQRVDHVPVHGGSLRMYAGHVERYADHADAVKRLIEEEHAAGLSEFGTYERFAAGVKANREALRGLLTELKNGGHTVAGYGAPAKGNTLLNYCGIDANLVEYTVDRSPKKVGLMTPGMHIPVVDADALLKRQPDYTLLLAWNFADEIMKQQQAYRDAGGRFIVPIPEPKVIE
ncbi:MAG: methyltransferase [Planctomycetaceae bacterium]|nr:methyltransferase [Planctomycetaceae bacterium]